MSRAVIYARVSSRAQEDNTSLDAQVRQCREYAAEKGYEVVRVLRMTHSGASADLPGIQQLLDIGQTNAADVVLVNTVDRFLRGDDADTDPGIDAAITERELNRAGLTVEYLDLPDRDSEAYIWMKTIKRMVASVELGDIRRRSTQGRRDRIRQGNVNTHGKPPFGYRVVVDPDGTRRFEIEEAEAATVRNIFRWYAYGDNGKRMSLRAIRRRLTADRVPTYADLHPGRGVTKGRRGYGEWGSSSVSGILKNETYAGVWTYGKTGEVQISVDVPAIIDRETWNVVCERRRKNKQNARRNTKHQYLMRRLVRCGACGLAMRAAATDDRNTYYRCPAHWRDLPCDVSPKHFSAPKVDTAVWDWLKAQFLDPDALRKALEERQAARAAEMAPHQDRLLAVRAEIAATEQRDELLIDIYLTGDITKAQYQERKARITATLADLRDQEQRKAALVARHTLDEEQITAILELAAHVRDGLTDAEDNFARRRWLIELLDVRAELTLEDGKHIVYAHCVAGDARLDCNQEQLHTWTQNMPNPLVLSTRIVLD